MTVLVTGASGQVGRALLATAPKDFGLIPCSRADLDIGDEPMVLAHLRQHAPHVVINTAAYTAVDRAESEPDLARKVNSLGPRYVATAAREVGARLIHLSTDFVFDGRSSVPYRPDDPPHPLSVYGQTKRAGEQAVLEVAGLSALVLRTAWVYAAQGRNFLNTMLRLMKGTNPVRVVADQIGTPTSATSLAQAIWRLVELPQLTGIHHWTDAGVASWYDFAVAIAEEAAALDLLSTPVQVMPIATEQYPTPARRPRYSVLDKSSLTAQGLDPIHWRVALRKVLGEIRNAPKSL